MRERNGFDYRILNALVGQLDDLEQARIAAGNRYRLLVQPADEVDKDGQARGLGLDPDLSPTVQRVRDTIDSVTALEKTATRGLEKYMRESPWGPWLASPQSRGVGAKQLARLLGAIGDPYWHCLSDRPRRVSELWSYSGYAVVAGTAPARRRGVRSAWSMEARKRAWLVACSCVKAGGHYRQVYDEAKARYADATHTRECVRCGPAGSPASAGSPISDGHRHARGLRAVSKEVLKDLWLESRRHHDGGVLP